MNNPKKEPKEFEPDTKPSDPFGELQTTEIKQWREVNRLTKDIALKCDYTANRVQVLHQQTRKTRNNWIEFHSELAGIKKLSTRVETCTLLLKNVLKKSHYLEQMYQALSLDQTEEEIRTTQKKASLKVFLRKEKNKKPKQTKPKKKETKEEQENKLEQKEEKKKKKSKTKSKSKSKKKTTKTKKVQEQPKQNETKKKKSEETEEQKRKRKLEKLERLQKKIEMMKKDLETDENDNTNKQIEEKTKTTQKQEK
ncbi:hypothetical protein M0812_10747 [Anaeramoeba flamelloides]|uniref:Uncharacterized protein n=1 Tax=Anaeramoeba flamelloides TaxID=1746091 RepID=A0AAV7ZSA2_9EUKA|nr:hypothetical protein M0812_10747 [Anaeramoeba flamelloides]